jgi:hypothetical protein
MNFSWGDLTSVLANWIVGRKKESAVLETTDNIALDAEPPIASFLKSMLIGGGPVNAVVT